MVMHYGDKVFGHLGLVHPLHIVAFGILDVRRFLTFRWPCIVIHSYNKTN